MPPIHPIRPFPFWSLDRFDTVVTEVDTLGYPYMLGR